MVRTKLLSGIDSLKQFCLIGALPESLINFRGELLKRLVACNYKVTAMASSTNPQVTSKLTEMKVVFKAFPIKRNGTNPFSDISTWLFLRKYFRTFRPDVVLAYTIKPIIWGGLACRVLPKTQFYALITGLGFAFQGGNLTRNILSFLVTKLYGVALSRATKVIFQNPDNLHEFVSRSIVPAEKCVLVNGSGVDTKEFAVTPLPNNKVVIFLTIGRLLGEKGFREYAKAARTVKEKYPDVVFQLLGPEDPSPDGLSLREINDWQQEGIIAYLGSADDVRPYIEACHIYVLPSYHEGMPRTVLEAMSIGRPILTTNVPGCRETVINGKNGYLVPKSDAAAY